MRERAVRMVFEHLEICAGGARPPISEMIRFIKERREVGGERHS